MELKLEFLHVLADVTRMHRVLLGGKNGVAVKEYAFQVAKLFAGSGSYSARMIDACSAIDMKPVCDHPRFCKDDASALYIGQSGHLANPNNRNSTASMPSGFTAIHSVWNGLCSYTGNANGSSAMCNAPSNSQSWRRAEQYNPGFVCGNTWTLSTYR